MHARKAGSLRGVRIEVRPPSGSASRRRTVDERLRVRAPALFQRYSEAVLRLPPRSRIRQAALARAMTRAYAAANRRDFELILASNDPASYEYHPSVDLLPPDFDSVYRGHQGYLAFWRRWLDAFEDIRWDRRRSSTSAPMPWSRHNRALMGRAAASPSAFRSFSCSPFGGAW